MTKKELQILFKEKGKTLDLRAGEILDLGHDDKVWFVMSGSVDLFFVEKDEQGKIISSRNLLKSRNITRKSSRVVLKKL